MLKSREITCPEMVAWRINWGHEGGMDRRNDIDLQQLWARYRRIMRYLWLATLIPVMIAGILIYRNEKVFAAKAYILVAMVAALVMLLWSAKLVFSYFRGK